MPTIKHGELEPALTALGELAAERTPMATAMKIRALIRQLGPLYAEVEAERLKLLDRYGQRDEAGELIKHDIGGGRFATPLADRAAFEAELAVLWALETEAPGIDAGSLGNIDVKAETLLGLGPLLLDAPAPTEAPEPALASRNGR